MTNWDKEVCRRMRRLIVKRVMRDTARAMVVIAIIAELIYICCW